MENKWSELEKGRSAPTAHLSRGTDLAFKQNEYEETARSDASSYEKQAALSLECGVNNGVIPFLPVPVGTKKRL